MDIGGTIRALLRFLQQHIAHGLAVALIGVIVVWAAPQGWSALPKVTMLWVALSGSQAVAWVTKEGGYFSRNGVDVDLVYLASSPTGAAALVSGRVEFVQMAGPAVVSANAGGAHLVMIMGFVNQPVFVVMATSDVQRPEQLKGKTVAVVRVGSSDDFMLREALSHWGLRANTDVNIVGVGSVSAQIAAIERRLVQAAVFSPPNDLLAQKVGAHLLARVSDLGIAYQAAGLVTTREYIRSHADVVAKVVRAMTQGVHRIKTDKVFSEEVIAKYLKITDPVVVDDAYEAYVNIFPRLPSPTKAGMQEIVREYLSTGRLKDAVDVSGMLNTSFVDQLQESGFIQQLYGR
ncbi:MAG TPA: ABC transporter substrate-binding protein [bacterium]|nr:ABC transporter substrate-binding protein [bacterium]